jgi:predicted O-linked N-acetylglucosamine transferase (SPINDLY family)
MGATPTSHQRKPILSSLQPVSDLRSLANRRTIFTTSFEQSARLPARLSLPKAGWKPARHGQPKKFEPSRHSGSLTRVNIDEAFATALQRQHAGQLAEAEAAYRRILAIDAHQPEVHYNLGLVLRSRSRLQEAVDAYEKALELRPRFPQAVNNLGATFESMGRLDEAEDMFRHALLLEPDSGDAWNNLGGVLKDLGRLDEAIDCLQRAWQLQPDNARIHSNLIFTLHYSPAHDAAALLQAARRWSEQHAAPLGRPNPSHGNDPSPGRRLRVGYLSGYFRDHCQALFTVPLLSHHDHDRFEIFGYCDVPVPDRMTGRLQTCTDVWRLTDKLDDAQIADLIRQDKIDVLVDLTLHMAHHRLLVFARKPAPVQVTWLGYPGTTGMEAIDYRLTDPRLDPPGATDALYAERSFRLPDSFWCYDPLTDQPAVNSLPAAQSGRITFGCLNNFCKINDGVLEMWARVLQAVPGSKLLLLAPRGAARTRVKAKLGLTAERVEFVAYQPRAEYLKLYHRIDLCLDTFPYNGHTTTLDALWMGVPVVSLGGSTAVSRAGLSLMANLGLPELVAESPAQFIRRAVELAQDRNRLAELRANLRERLAQSPLMDAGRFTRNVEHAYRTMWQSWCASQPAGPKPSPSN